MPQTGDEAARASVSAVTYLRGIRLDDSARGHPEEHPWSLPVVRALDVLDLDVPVVFLVGDNGSGKSTVLEATAVCLGLNPEGGTQNVDFATSDTHSNLGNVMRPVMGAARPRTKFFLRAESFYNLATRMDELEEEEPGLLASYGGESLHRQSHGESFLATILNRFEPQGLYLLDEPEAALSPQGILTLLATMHRLVTGGAQFIVATHSPMLMAFPEARIYELGQGGFTETTYEDTDHYRLTRAFLENREGFFRRLFEEEAPR